MHKWLDDSWVPLLAIHLVVFVESEDTHYSICAKNAAGFALHVATAATYFHWHHSSQRKEDSKSCQSRNILDLGTLGR